MQVATLVNHIARGRWVDPEMFNASIHSIFVLEPQNTLEVYGNNINNVQLGLRKLTTFFPRPDKQNDADVARYLFGCILLTSSLRNDTARMENVGKAIKSIRTQSSSFLEQPDDLLLAQLAHVYLEQISPLKRRIHVLGSQTILKQPQEMNRIRALLLAGIRSSILWQQVGGRLWHLWWQRGKIAEMAKTLL
jgi:high frequency lysogenization protein